MNGASGQAWRAASNKFRVPTALVSKSSKGIARRSVVAGLRSGVNHHVGLDLLDQCQHGGAVPDVRLVVDKPRNRPC